MWQASSAFCPATGTKCKLTISTGLWKHVPQVFCAQFSSVLKSGNFLVFTQTHSRTQGKPQTSTETLWRKLDPAETWILCWCKNWLCFYCGFDVCILRVSKLSVHLQSVQRRLSSLYLQPVSASVLWRLQPGLYSGSCESLLGSAPRFYSYLHCHVLLISTVANSSVIYTVVYSV